MQRTFYWLFAAILAVSVVGERWQPLWEYIFGGPSPLWRRVVTDLQWLDKQLLEWGMFPTGIAVGVLGLFITWLWPDIWDKITGYNRFLARLVTVYQANTIKFHNLTSRAYSVWKSGQTGVPETLDEVINRTNPKICRGFYSTRVSDVEGALKAINPTLWEFSEKLYREIQNSLSKPDFEPTLLKKDDCLELTSARKNLADFWNVEGRRVYSVVGRLFIRWQFSRIDEQLEDRLLVILPFLEAALARQISKRVAAPYLFRLSARAIKLWHAANT